MRTCTIHVWHPLSSSTSEDQHPPRLEVVERLVQPLKNAPFPRRRSSVGTSLAHSSVFDAARAPATDFCCLLLDTELCPLFLRLLSTVAEMCYHTIDVKQNNTVHLGILFDDIIPYMIGTAIIR